MPKNPPICIWGSSTGFFIDTHAVIMWLARQQTQQCMLDSSIEEFFEAENVNEEEIQG